MMNFGVLLLLLAVLIIVLILLAKPFIQTQNTGITMSNSAQSSLLAEKERVLQSIEELDSDHQSGKVPDEVYQSQRRLMLFEAAEVLEKLKAERGIQSGGSRSETESTGSHLEYDALEEMISKRKVTLEQKSKGFCQKCGKAVLVTDRYCPKCGTVLVHEERA